MAFEVTPDLSRKFKGATPFFSPMEAFGSDVQVPTGFSAPQAVPMAGRWSNALDALSSMTPEAIAKDPLGYALASSALYQSSPEARKQAIQDQQAHAKELGDQMMKYRMMNEIIANFGSAARSAFARYTDPGAIANRIGGIGDAYARGMQASAGLSQLGSNQPTIQYYRT